MKTIILFIRIGFNYYSKDCLIVSKVSELTVFTPGEVTEQVGQGTGTEVNLFILISGFLIQNIIVYILHILS